MDFRVIQSSNSDYGSLTKLKNFARLILTLPKQTHWRQKKITHVVFLSLQFLGEIKLLGLQCQEPLPQIICLLPIEQKAGVCHRPAAKKRGGRVRSANARNEK